MQTKTGKKPQAVASSDMAALLEVMLKEFRKAAGEAGRGQPGNTYNDVCAAMSEELGKEVEQPFWVSMDNAKVHPHGRLRLMTRRDPPPPILADMRKQIFPLLTAASMSSTDIETRFEALLLKFVPDFIASQSAPFVVSAPFADACIELYYELCETPGCTIARPELFHMHRYRLHWDQFMPLPPLSPDLHSPIEHMVGTIKGKIKRWAREQDKHSPTLFEAATWQRAVTGIMNEFVVGGVSCAANHCMGSITKWKNCVKIVAANKGDVVDCEISPPELKRKRGRQPNAARLPRAEWPMVHVQEKGTGGGWAPAAYC